MRYLLGLTLFIVLVLSFVAGPGLSTSVRVAEAKGGGTKSHACTLAAHGSLAHRIQHDKPDGTPGNGGGGGGQKGGGDKLTCGKTFASWDQSTISIYVDDTGRPGTIAAGVLDSYTDFALDEWDCHSGLGETITFTTAANAASADIVIGWGDVGSTGILGQALTTYFGGVIQTSTITMNSNQSAFTWTAGPAPSVDADGCAVEVANGNTSSYDLLSVLLHEIGHALGISHPTNRCSARDRCYAESMYSCTDSGEYMRRTLNDGDKGAVQSLYGEDS